MRCIIIFFCDLKPHVKFHNPRTTPSGRKVRVGEEERREITPLIVATTSVQLNRLNSDARTNYCSCLWGYSQKYTNLMWLLPCLGPCVFEKGGGLENSWYVFRFAVFFSLNRSFWKNGYI